MTIVYQSKTGFTRQYAEMLARAAGLKALPLDEAQSTLPKGEDILFMGWLMAGHISGIDQAVRLWKVRAACGVGMTPASDSVLATMTKANYVPGASLFYLPGGWAPQKVGWFQRRAVGMVTRSIRRTLREKGDKRTEQEQAYYDTLVKGGSLVKLRNLKPVQEWLEKQG